MTAAQLEDPEGRALVAAIHERKHRADRPPGRNTMSTKIVEQTITSRTDPGDFKATIERYKANGWTLEAEADGQALLSHPGITGAKVRLFDSEGAE